MYFIGSQWRAHEKCVCGESISLELIFWNLCYTSMKLVRSHVRLFGISRRRSRAKWIPFKCLSLSLFLVFPSLSVFFYRLACVHLVIALPHSYQLSSSSFLPLKYTISLAVGAVLLLFSRAVRWCRQAHRSILIHFASIPKSKWEINIKCLLTTNLFI